MPIPLDVITRKKLILVRQLYQRALLQSEAQHSYVDRIMALIGFDLSNETVLKAVVGTLEPAKAVDKDFQAVIQQADAALTKASLPQVPDKAKIQHVHSLRNDAQHKAKYPNDTDVSDCRTYTRDFLKQIILDVWNENFRSLSLVDVVQNKVVKSYLTEAETELVNGNYKEAVVKCIAAMDWTFSRVKNSIVGRIPYNTNAFVVAETFGGPKESTEVFKSFMYMRDLIMRLVIGLDFPGYVKYKHITQFTAVISFSEAGNYVTRFKGYDPDVKETEYVFEFATNAVIQIESLVGTIDKPFEI